MSSNATNQTLARRLAFLKAVKPLAFDEPEIKEAQTARVQGGPGEEENVGIFPQNLFPLPKPVLPDENTVPEIEALVTESQDDLNEARTVLENPAGTSSDAPIDWKVSLFQLLTAWIVNFRDEDAQEELVKAVKSGNEDAITKALDPPLEYIRPAAASLGLTYIPFVDLATVPINPGEEKERSGPYAGVFVQDGAKPFMILSFKGTTNAMEGNTDEYAIRSGQLDHTLYNRGVHLGMYQGLFKVFEESELDKTAFAVILASLEEEAAKLRGDKPDKVPLYVNGHSLGAGYAQLAYVELFRLLVDPATSNKPDVSYTLKDLYALAAPRVGTKFSGTPLDTTGFAKRVRDKLDGKSNRIFRFANEHDVVPFVPGNTIINIWLHLDGGYILHRNHKTGNDYHTKWKSEIEIDEAPYLDTTGHSNWDHHFPNEYYRGIRKAIHPDVLMPYPPTRLCYLEYLV